MCIVSFKVYVDQTARLLKIAHIFCPSIPDIMLKINNVNLESQMRLKQKMYYATMVLLKLVFIL